MNHPPQSLPVCIEGFDLGCDTLLWFINALIRFLNPFLLKCQTVKTTFLEMPFFLLLGGDLSARGIVCRRVDVAPYLASYLPIILLSSVESFKRPGNWAGKNPGGRIIWAHSSDICLYLVWTLIDGFLLVPISESQNYCCAKIVTHITLTILVHLQQLLGRLLLHVLLALVTIVVFFAVVVGIVAMGVVVPANWSDSGESSWRRSEFSCRRIQPCADDYQPSGSNATAPGTFYLHWLRLQNINQLCIANVRLYTHSSYWNCDSMFYFFHI